MDWTAQRGDHAYRHTLVAFALQQVAFGAERRPGDQQHLVTMTSREILAAQECVLLRSADDHPRYDMRDFHQQITRGSPWLRIGWRQVTLRIALP
jgi:hypothetical protein